MKKQIIIVAVIAILCSCNSISDKPIYEELTIDEIGKAMKQDSSFGWFYDDVVKANYALKMSPSEKAKFKKVSYRKYFAYTKYKYDFLKWMEKDSVWAKEWSQRYATEINSVDSAISYWKQYKESRNSEIHKYIKGELVNVSYDNAIEYNWQTQKEEWMIHRVLEIDYTLNVPKVDKIEFQVAWKDQYGHSDGFSKYGRWGDKNITKANSKQKYRTGGAPLGKTPSMPIEILITKIEIGSKIITTDYYQQNIPSAINEYLFNEDRRFLWDKAGREVLGENFVSESDYLEIKKKEDLRAFDNLCYEFDQEF